MSQLDNSVELTVCQVDRNPVHQTHSPVELRLNLDKKGVKLENSSFEAECLPDQRIKSPQEFALGKKSYRGKFKMAAGHIEKAVKIINLIMYHVQLC